MSVRECVWIICYLLSSNPSFILFHLRKRERERERERVRERGDGYTGYVVSWWYVHYSKLAAKKEVIRHILNPAD